MPWLSLFKFGLPAILLIGGYLWLDDLIDDKRQLEKDLEQAELDIESWKVANDQLTGSIKVMEQAHSTQIAARENSIKAEREARVNAEERASATAKALDTEKQNDEVLDRCATMELPSSIVDSLYDTAPSGPGASGDPGSDARIR